MNTSFLRCQFKSDNFSVESEAEFISKSEVSCVSPRQETLGNRNNSRVLLSQNSADYTFHDNFLFNFFEDVETFVTSISPSVASTQVS